MRKLYVALFLLCSYVGFAQLKTISTSEAALSYKYGLYPNNLYFLDWVDNSNTYYYYDFTNYILVDANNNNQIIISPQEIKNAYPELSYIPLIKYINDSYLVFEFNKIYYLYDYKQHKSIKKIALDEKAENHIYNPESQSVAYTIDNNLYVANADNPKQAITEYENKNIVSGQSIHRNEFGINGGIFWSPQGNYIAFYQKDESNITEYPLVNVHTVPASLKSIKYPMAGQKSEMAKVGIFNLTTKKTYYLDIDTSDEHYLTNLSWATDEKSILLAEVNRGQDTYHLNQYNVESGKKIKTILSEHNDKWVEPENEAIFIPKKNNEFLWLSEKDGFMNLYLYTINGKLVRKVTNFKWIINRIIGFDAKAEHVFVSTTGADPREEKTFKIHIKSGKYIDVTPQEGTHDTKLSYDGSFLIDQYSNINLPNKIDIVNLSNLKRTTILESQDPLKDYNLGTIELLKLKADDGKTDLYGKIIKPKNFDPNKKYPVLLYVYGGPHAQLVTNSWLASTPIWMLAMAANEDYIIFTIDNRGSSKRGFAFESVIHRNLATYAVKDQLTAVKYLKEQPYVNANRLAVYGWSFGGFLTSSLMLRHPNVFTTAVAGGAVIDWSYYEVMYGERYMDTPKENPEGYKDTHITNYINNLNGKLLYIHGYIDNVVLPQHMLSVTNAAIKNGKIIEQFYYPNHEHNVNGEDYKHLVKLISEYIVTHNVDKSAK